MGVGKVLGYGFLGLVGLSVLGNMLGTRNTATAPPTSTATPEPPPEPPPDPAAEKKKAEANEAERVKKCALLATLAAKHDDMTGVTWLEDKATFGNRSAHTHVKLYFGKEKGSLTGLRLFMMYHAEKWLFVQRATVKVGDTVYEYAPSRWERDHHSSIWEWTDEALSRGSDAWNMVKDMTSGKPVKIRFHGSQYEKDWVVPPAQLAAMRRVWNVWDDVPNALGCDRPAVAQHKSDGRGAKKLAKKPPTE
jgi:hypothetical protein